MIFILTGIPINPSVTGNYQECLTTILKKPKSSAKDPRIKLLAQNYVREMNPQITSKATSTNAEGKSPVSSNSKSNDTSQDNQPEDDSQAAKTICKTNVKKEDEVEPEMIAYPLDHLKRKKKNSLGYGVSLFAEDSTSSIVAPPPVYAARSSNNSSESLSKYLERLAEHVQKRSKTEKVQFIAFDK